MDDDFFPDKPEAWVEAKIKDLTPFQKQKFEEILVLQDCSRRKALAVARSYPLDMK